MYRHLLIPTDGSELAHKAVVQGLSLAKLCGAKVTALTVEHPFYAMTCCPLQKWTTSLEYLWSMRNTWKRILLNILREVASAAKDSGVPCDLLQIEQDQTHEAIIAVATKNGCDLIVMASHGRSGLAAVLLGSVTVKVLTHTKLPVLVCH